MNSKYLELKTILQTIKNQNSLDFFYCQLNKNGIEGLKKDWETLNDIEKKSLIKKIQEKDLVL